MPSVFVEITILVFRVGARILVKATLGCQFIHVHALFIHEIYFNPHLEDSSSNLDFVPRIFHVLGESSNKKGKGVVGVQCNFNSYLKPNVRCFFPYQM